MRRPFLLCISLCQAFELLLQHIRILLHTTSKSRRIVKDVHILTDGFIVALRGGRKEYSRNLALHYSTRQWACSSVFIKWRQLKNFALECKIREKNLG